MYIGSLARLLHGLAVAAHAVNITTYFALGTLAFFMPSAMRRSLHSFAAYVRRM
jgi:hypothetical protein